MRTYRACLIVAVLLLSLIIPAAAQQPAYVPEFESTECWENVQASECGYVVVPEDRAEPDGAQVRLAVAIVRSQLPNPSPDPVIFLAGGPGENGLIYAQLAPLYGNRDFIAFDHRGAGLSEPALECPEYFESLSAADAETEPDALAEAATETLIGCGERLASEGIDLTAYNTAEAAADVNDIRLALGYEQVNLVGISYGTRLAQAVMRDYSDTLRSVVMDSVIPTAIDRVAETPIAANAALERVFEACAQDEACNAAYPDLPAVYAEVITTLNENPIPFTMDVDGESVESPINGDTLQGLIFASLYTAPGVAEIPSLIYAVSEGNTEILESSAAVQFAEAVAGALSFGLFFATECRSEIAFTTPETLAATYEELPNWENTLGLYPGISSARAFEICAGWGLTEPREGDNDPVTSDVPTLLMAGEFDPVTPPTWLELTAEGLSNAYLYEVPGMAHAASVSDLCALGIVQAFINDPTVEPPTDCLATLRIQFVIEE